MKSRWYLIFLCANLISKGMVNPQFDDLVASIRNGQFNRIGLLFSQCKMIWPEQIPTLAWAINSSDLRSIDYVMYCKLQILVSIYSDAIKGKLQCNDYYLNCSNDTQRWHK